MYMKNKIILIVFIFCFQFVFAQKGTLHNIPLKTTVGGLHEIKAEINGVLTLPFILDTGASSLTLPPTAVRMLILSKTLTVKDTLKGQYYVYANGQVSYCRRFLIRKLKIGGVTLRNVECTVSDSDNSPLLLGQAVLRKFKRYTINNKTNTLWVRTY